MWGRIFNREARAVAIALVEWEDSDRAYGDDIDWQGLNRVIDAARKAVV